MSKIHRTRTWQVEVPEGWSVNSSDDAAILFKPDGVGTLMVFCSEQAGSFETSAAEPFSGKLSGTVRISQAGGDFRKTWRLTCRDQTVFVRYSCASKNAKEEVSEVDKIVQSISEA